MSNSLKRTRGRIVYSKAVIVKQFYLKHSSTAGFFCELCDIFTRAIPLKTCLLNVQVYLDIGSQKLAILTEYMWNICSQSKCMIIIKSSVVQYMSRTLQVIKIFFQMNPAALTPPPNYFTLSLLTCLFCCWPVSIFALRKSSEVGRIGSIGLTNSVKEENWTKKLRYQQFNSIFFFLV